MFKNTKQKIKIGSQYI